MRAIGIDDIELATTHHVVRLDDYAAANDTDPNKYRLGLGQDEFSFPAPDEDIVTMAAAATAPIIERCGTEGIRTLLFATESGTDQSKAAGLAVHSLLGLPSQMRIVEFKEACYSATAALQAAVGIVTRSPGQRVLVIASPATSSSPPVSPRRAPGPWRCSWAPIRGWSRSNRSRG